MKSGNNDRSTTFGPTSLLPSIYLAPAPSVTVDNDKHKRHIEKQISQDLMNGEKTTLPI
jgi:hypothetical protein